MFTRVIQILLFITGAGLGIIFFPKVFEAINFNNPVINNGIALSIIGGSVFYLGTFWLAEPIVKCIKWAEERLIKIPLIDILFGSVGLLMGLVVAYLLSLPLNSLGIPVLDQIMPVVLTCIFGYLGVAVAVKKRYEFLQMFPNRLKRVKSNSPEEKSRLASIKSLKPKILDTSVIIDGRIADICQTGFLEGKIIIPQFVLFELQYIADSADTLKRTRGRRGLDILNRLQKDMLIQVEMVEDDFDDLQEVDAKLVKLAKKLEGVLVTNDLNLNKVSEFQHVSVLNINDLANAVKPVVMPGEDMDVVVIKDGKEQNQGVAYLDDGTMIVVAEGREHIGKNIRVTVTSVLQTSAGRMIFAKLKTAN